MTEDNKQIIVSLTSWPKRISNVATVVKSILDQDVHPDIIQINLSIDEFPKYEGLPADLLSLITQHHEVQIEWVDRNDGVFKKIIPTLKKHCGEDYLLLSIDDDVIYHNGWIRMMVDNLRNSGGDSFCPSNGRVVGNRMIYKSSCFEPDFWVKLTPEVVSTRIDDMYIEHYLDVHHKVMAHYRPKNINDMWELYNSVYPNSHSKDGQYSAADISRAHKIIKAIKFV